MLVTLGTLLGGLGIFLLAVSMITDGLKLAAGRALRDILARSTRTPVRGIASGFLLTSVVLSSSAVTIATIGFVNAGLLGLKQAMSIILGATIGTTMMGWLVSIVGFDLNIASFALPMVGLGMMMRLFGPSRRLGAVGEAVAGFGLFFIGVDFLGDAFENVSASIDLESLRPQGLMGIAMFVLIGLVTTVLTQSSGAAIALALTAMAGGLIQFPEAAAATIGATVGTTSTSALAVIGATPNAKRVAASHVLINSFNAMVGLALLPLAIMAFNSGGSLSGNPAMAVALFHTVFNTLGVILQQPLSGRFSNWLARRFTNFVEQLGRPQYLDRNVIASPSLAMDAFLLELQRMAALTRQHAAMAASHQAKDLESLQDQHDGLRQLAQAVEMAVTRLETDRLHSDIARQLPQVLRIAGYIDEAVAQAQENVEHHEDVKVLLKGVMRDQVIDYQKAVVAMIEYCDPQLPGFDVSDMEARYQSLREQWRALKTELLEAGANRQLPVASLNPAIDNLRILLRVAERVTRIASRMRELAQSLPEVRKSGRDETQLAGSDQAGK
ncbi:Na/Pi symporter [Pseudohongiella sp. SYSU M77423]|uniref:Na/Pi cotransporter family protein n=1 Tax=unclassified Pseudohongiella TaxID=2629611 RepID=UPI001F014DC8|nr:MULTISPECIES: Na/Pi symporter [unclassified Pseudohongiella]MDH7944823.1 Na/Pi symporter [Pseudohongiella sp. SYSU M77423]